jgi:hypothetical protein
MIDFIKKFSTYLAATITFLIAFKVAFGFVLTWQLDILIVLTVIIICFAIAWLEVFPRTGQKLPLLQDEGEDGSISLSVKRAMKLVKYADRGDESIAFEANKLVRRGLDKHCIKYKDYKLWRKKNRLIFTAITDEENRLIGFFDIFPLTDEAIKGLIDGKCKEIDLDIDAILPYEQNNTAKNIYIASIMVKPKQKSYSSIVAKEVLLLKFAEFLLNSFPPNGERSIFAFAHTIPGEKLLKNARFKNTVLSHDNKQKDPLYELSPIGYSDLLKSYFE